MKNPYNPDQVISLVIGIQNRMKMLFLLFYQIKVGRYYEEKVVKDATNREMSLKNTIKTY